MTSTVFNPKARDLLFTIETDNSLHQSMCVTHNESRYFAMPLVAGRCNYKSATKSCEVIDHSNLTSHLYLKK